MSRTGPCRHPLFPYLTVCLLPALRTHAMVESISPAVGVGPTHVLVGDALLAHSCAHLLSLPLPPYFLPRSPLLRLAPLAGVHAWGGVSGSARSRACATRRLPRRHDFPVGDRACVLRFAHSLLFWSCTLRLLHFARACSTTTFFSSASTPHTRLLCHLPTTREQHRPKRPRMPHRYAAFRNNTIQPIGGGSCNSRLSAPSPTECKIGKVLDKVQRH